MIVAPDRHLELTEEGRVLATQVLRKHRLAERLLADVIGLDWSLVHDEAWTTYLVAATDGTRGAAALVVAEGIRRAAARGTGFDFEGSMLRNVESFVRSFGGVPTDGRGFGKIGRMGIGVIVNPRGTSGAGKTEFARRVMAAYGWPGEGRAEPIRRAGRERPIGYSLPHPGTGRPLAVALAQTRTEATT